MVNPIVNLLAEVLSLYSYILMAYIILSVLISFKIVNAYQPIVRKISMILERLCEPALRPIQKYVYKFFGDLGGFDISPIILILFINFLRNSLYYYF